MPAQPAWFQRLDEILFQLEAGKIPTQPRGTVAFRVVFFGQTCLLT